MASSRKKPSKMLSTKRPSGALAMKRPSGNRGREALTADQLVFFYKALLAHGPAWTAVLFIAQLMLGDRADCSRSCTTSWLHLSLPKPYISIPEQEEQIINRKTMPRHIPVHAAFAKWLLQMMTASPVQGAKGCWPFTGQGLVSECGSLNPDVLLFPGRVLGGVDCRQWDKPISERAYLENVVAVGKILERERQDHHIRGLSHAFDDVNMRRIGTHSLKKSAITLMKDAHVQTKIVGALTGTSPKLVESVYYQATMAKCREAVETTFTPVLEGLGAMEGELSAPSYLPAGFCPKCNVQKKEPQWLYCPMCGSEFHAAA